MKSCFICDFIIYVIFVRGVIVVGVKLACMRCCTWCSSGGGVHTGLLPRHLCGRPKMTVFGYRPQMCSGEVGVVCPSVELWCQVDICSHR